MASKIIKTISAGREEIPTLQIVSSLKQKLGTWDKVAKSLKVTTRTIRRWRDGTRNPDRGKSKANIKATAKRKRIPTTQEKELPKSLNKKDFKSLESNPNDIQVIVKYQITFENGQTENRYESFIAFAPHDPQQVQAQTEDLAESIRKSKTQSRRTARITKIYFKQV